MLCILYVIVITAALGVAALLAERALPARWPRRGLWCAVIAMSLIVPPMFKAQHAVAITTLLPTARHLPGESRGATSIIPLLDASWWLESGSYLRTIYQLWIVASLVLIAWAVAHAVRTRRALGATSSKPDGTDFIDGTPVVIADGIGPATVGVWRPRIVIPRWVIALPPRQRRYVMRHEQEHQQSRDGMLLAASAVALVLTPWNVPLYWILRRLRLALELDCDQRVVRALGDEAGYASVLLDVAAAAQRHPGAHPVLLGATHSLEHRLRTLVSPARPGWASRVAAPVIAALLLLTALLLPHPVLPAPSAAAHDQAGHSGAQHGDNLGHLDPPGASRR